MSRIEGYNLCHIETGATFASYANDIGTWFFGVVIGVTEQNIIASMPNSKGGSDTISFDRYSGLSDYSGQIRYVGLLPETPDEWDAPVSFMAHQVSAGRAVVFRDLPEPSIGPAMNF